MTTSTNESFKELIQLSKLDNRLVEIERKKKKIPILLDKIQQKLDSGRSNYVSLKNSIDEKEARRKLLTEEANEFQENVKKSKARLYDIKTNEAYRLALKEIDNWEHEVKIREDEILKIMEDLEKKQPEIEQLKQSFQPEEQKLLEEEAKIKEDLNKHEMAIRELMQEREKNTKNIDKRIYNQYERIRLAKGGIALVEVHSPSCTGCNLGIRPQLYNQLIQGKIQRCSHCGRLMYFTEKNDDSRDN